jgi:hypothetical protein
VSSAPAPGPGAVPPVAAAAVVAAVAVPVRSVSAATIDPGQLPMLLRDDLFQPVKLLSSDSNGVSLLLSKIEKVADKWEGVVAVSANVGIGNKKLTIRAEKDGKEFFTLPLDLIEGLEGSSEALRKDLENRIGHVGNILFAKKRADAAMEGTKQLIEELAEATGPEYAINREVRSLTKWMCDFALCQANKRPGSEGNFLSRINYHYEGTSGLHFACEEVLSKPANDVPKNGTFLAVNHGKVVADAFFRHILVAESGVQFSCPQLHKFANVDDWLGSILCCSSSSGVVQEIVKDEGLCEEVKQFASRDPDLLDAVSAMRQEMSRAIREGYVNNSGVQVDGLEVKKAQAKLKEICDADGAKATTRKNAVAAWNNLCQALKDYDGAFPPVPAIP